MSPLWNQCKPLLKSLLTLKHLPFTILIVLSAVSLLCRLILLLR